MSDTRAILVVLGLAFSCYLAARGLWWSEPIPLPGLVIASLVLYVPTTLVCLLWQPRAAVTTDPEDSADGLLTVGPGGPSRLPIPAVVLALYCAFAIPTAVALAVGENLRTAPFATWYLGGLGALMTIVMVRRRPWAAWVGTTALAVGSAMWIGLLPSLALGLTGSIVWVAAAQLLIWLLDRAAKDTARLSQLQSVASAWQTSNRVRQRERRVQVQRALAVAGPILTRVVHTGGALSEEERLDARVAEGTLRDELRGPRLLDDVVREALRGARRRGVTVTLLDEGGLDSIPEVVLREVRAQLATTVRSARSHRLYIRTSTHNGVVVSVVGRSGEGQGPSDEDDVDLWEEIPVRVRA